MPASISSSESLCKKLNEMNLESGFVSFPYCDIKASAQSGCTLCCAVHDIIAAYVDVTKFTSSPSEVSASVYTSGVHINCARTCFELFSQQGGPQKPKAIPLAKDISGYTGSNKSFERAKEWLQDCFNNHRTLCEGSNFDRRLPNRILDLGMLDTSGKVRLVETSPGTGFYACLSHCWGKIRPLVTTSETLAQHKSGIPFDVVPKTFQDAITFACRMSIRYLWIDSLCIIQDDEEDWRRESALMAEIYRNAVITIAASAAIGSTDGLFASADPKLLAQELTSFHDCVDHQGLFVRKDLPHARRGLALLGRGWFFQERLLSPRVLHFGHSELLWECMEQSHCECGRLQSVHILWPFQKKFYRAALLNIFTPRRVADIWREIVQDYTQMSLTFEKDIFPAISGAAKMMEMAIKSRYIAGLWEHSIMEDLLWSTSERENTKRPSIWRAPTFSWAAVTSKTGNRGVQFEMMSIISKLLDEVPEPQNTNIKRVYAKLIEAKCTLAGPDHTGELLSGCITLTGPLVRGLVKEANDSYSSNLYELYFPGQSDLPNRDRPGRFFPDYDWDIEGDCQVRPGSTIFFLKLLSIKAFSWQRQYLMGLVLRRVDEVDKTYERIGLLKYMEGLEPDMETWFQAAEVESDAIVRII